MDFLLIAASSAGSVGVETVSATSANAEGFGLTELFLRADIIVKAVMGLLALMSVWSLATAIDRWRALRELANRLNAAEELVRSGFEDADTGAERARDPLQRALAQSAREVRHLDLARAGDGAYGLALERADLAFTAVSEREIRRVERGFGTLATIGATATFIGLFGTVWGIMNAFRSIAATQDTHLGVVAPGIAEALFATALGLVAAIPAVIFYNALSGALDELDGRLSTLNAEAKSRLARRMLDGTR